jgi:hypothetical protein
MSNNPLEDDPARDERIRVRAYHLWEADGCPTGREVEYWERARELVGIEESPGAGAAAERGTIDEASIQANLGEFPDRFTDQGDRLETPMTREQMRKRSKSA